MSIWNQIWPTFVFQFADKSDWLDQNTSLLPNLNVISDIFSLYLSQYVSDCHSLRKHLYNKPRFWTLRQNVLFQDHILSVYIDVLSDKSYICHSIGCYPRIYKMSRVQMRPRPPIRSFLLTEVFSTVWDFLFIAIRNLWAGLI